MSAVLSLEAISAALKGSWNEAISFNKKILEKDPTDVVALNRLAYAYLELGDIDKAKYFYGKVLKFDPCNSIALKNLKKIQDFYAKKVAHDPYSSPKQSLPRLSFLEEPGKTKVIKLVKIASKSTLSQLRPANQLLLYPRKHSVAVFDSSKNYVGLLPDDLSFRLLKFIRGGNRYEVFVRSVSKNSISVFLRETFRSSRFKNLPTFLTKPEVVQEVTSGKPSKINSFSLPTQEEFSSSASHTSDNVPEEE